MDYNLALQKIKDWIKNLIIVQYRQSPKNRALIDLLCELIFANNLILKIRDLCLNVEESTGAQLDVVGKWVGIDRIYNGTELWDHPYLSFINYSDIKDANFPSNLDPMQGGFSKYTTFADNNGGFLMYKQWMDTRTAVNKIGDDIFRKIIKLKIIKNSINQTQENIDKAIWKWSEGHVFTTWIFTLYSLVPATADTILYQAETIDDFIKENEEKVRVSGTVKSIGGGNIAIKGSNDLEFYSGSYTSETVTKTVDGITKTVYVYTMGEPMKVTYHYDAEYKNIMTVASFKDVLPHPTGCEIELQMIV